MMNPTDIFTALETPPDPSSAAPYPRGLALDLALEVGSLEQILASYGLTPAQFASIQNNPAFKQEFEGHQESMKTEGWSFRKKAQAQAELYLNLMYRMASSDTTPAAVRADIMKNTVKWAGLDAPNGVAANPEAQMPQLLEQMKTLADGELEMRVFQIISRKQQREPDIFPPVVTHRTHEPHTIDVTPTKLPAPATAPTSEYDPLNS